MKRREREGIIENEISIYIYIYRHEMERNAGCKPVSDTLLPEDSGEGEAEGRGH